METARTEARFEQVEMGRINIQDKRFGVAFPAEADEEFVASVREFGLYLPVILQERNKSLLRIVSGNRRIAAARTAGLESVPARIISREMNDKALFLLNVRENAVTRVMNEMERSMTLHRLMEDFGTEEKEVLEVMPLLGLASSKRVLHQYIGLVRLIPELKRYVVSRAVPIRVSSRMAAWTDENQRALYGLLKAVQMSGNTLNEILDLLEELSLRDHTTVSGLFLRKEIREIKEAPRLTSTQRRAKLKQRLLVMRYPMLSKRTEEISELLRQGGTLPGILLNPPPYLEGSSLHVSFSFGSMKELQEKAEGLLALASRDEIEKVLRRLQVREDG